MLTCALLPSNVSDSFWPSKRSYFFHVYVGIVKAYISYMVHSSYCIFSEMVFPPPQWPSMSGAGRLTMFSTEVTRVKVTRVKTVVASFPCISPPSPTVKHSQDLFLGAAV